MHPTPQTAQTLHNPPLLPLWPDQPPRLLPPRLVQIVAHGRATELEPANTPWAMHRAAAIGCHGFAADVRVSADGHPVLAADTQADAQVGGRAEGMGPISTFTLADLRRLDLGLGETIPTLDEALDLARGRLHLYLHIHDLSAIQPTLQRVRRHAMYPQVTLVCARSDLLTALDGLRPRLTVEYRVDRVTPETLYRAVIDRATHVAVHIDALPLAFLSHGRDAGLRVGVWGCTDLARIYRGIMAGVDYLVTPQAATALSLWETVTALVRSDISYLREYLREDRLTID